MLASVSGGGGFFTPRRCTLNAIPRVPSTLRGGADVQQVPFSANFLLTERGVPPLNEQHHEYESQLGDFTEKVVLSDEEQVEETTLKKKKLQLKDRMEAIARQGRERAAHP